MIRFTNDYSQGCHPSILEALQATNLEGNFGYSMDPHTEHARQLIRQAIGRPDADVHLLVGGTQANATAISAFLRPHEAVIAAESGHMLCGMMGRTAENPCQADDRRKLSVRNH